jgi:hypothetical protein
LVNICLMNTVTWLSDRSAGGYLTSRRIKASLDEVLSFGLRHQRLELCGSKGIDETGLGDDEKEHLGTCQGG